MMQTISVLFTDYFNWRELLFRTKSLKNYEGSHFDETSVLTLVYLDAILTDIVDNLSQAIENTEKAILQRVEEEGAAGSNSTKENTGSVKKLCNKGANIPQRSAENLKSILSFSSE